MTARAARGPVARGLRAVIVAAEELDEALSSRPAAHVSPSHGQLSSGFYTAGHMIALRGAIVAAKIALGEGKDVVCPLCSGKHPIQPLAAGQSCPVCGAKRAW